MEKGRKVISKHLALTIFDTTNKHNKEKLAFFKKYDDGFFEVSKNIYVDIENSHYKTSFLPNVYGDYISRTNEKSFASLFNEFHKTLDYMNKICSHKLEFLYSSTKQENVETLAKYLDNNLKDKDDFINLWHVMQLVNTSLYTSHKPSFNFLLSFFSIMEIILIKDLKRTARKEYTNKLPFFLKSSLIPVDLFVANPQEFTSKLVDLRNKVIHGDIREAQKILELIINDDECSIEDVESSRFFQKIQILNSFLMKALGSILSHWIVCNSTIQVVKNDENLTEGNMKKLINTATIGLKQDLL